MIDGAWNVKRFGSGPASALKGTLAGYLDAVFLARDVAECAAAEDLLCCERPIACKTAAAGNPGNTTWAGMLSAAYCR